MKPQFTVLATFFGFVFAAAPLAAQSEAPSALAGDDSDTAGPSVDTDTVADKGALTATAPSKEAEQARDANESPTKSALEATPVAAAQEPNQVQLASPNAAPAKKKKKKLKVLGRIHAGWEMKHRVELPPNEGEDASSSKKDKENQFYLRRARLKLIWEHNDWLRGVVQLDVAQALEVGSSLLRDAYINIAPFSFLELRVGQFKKPFSGLALISPSKLKVVDRGPGNDLIVEDLLYGERDLGVQLAGRLVDSIDLDYSVGAFNGSGPNLDDKDRSKDLAGRLSLQPFKPLVIGANGSIKFFQDAEPAQPTRGYGGGGDIRLKLWDVRLYAEALAARNHLAWLNLPSAKKVVKPVVFDFVGMVSYKINLPVSFGLALEPVFKLELLDTDSDIVDDEVLVYTAGINTYFGEYLRLMISGEFLRSKRNAGPDYLDKDLLSVLTCLDI